MSFIALVCFLLLFGADAIAQDRWPDPAKMSKDQRAVNSRLVKNDYEGAVRLLDALIREGKELEYAFTERAFIKLIFLRDHEGSLEDLNKAAELNPANQSVHLRRANMLQSHRKDLPAALKALDLAINLDGPVSKSHILMRRAEVKAEVGDLDGAIEDYRLVIAEHSENPSPLIETARVMYRQGNTDEAISYLEIFLKEFVEKRGGKIPKLRGITVKKNPPKDLLPNNFPVARYSTRFMNASGPEHLSKLMQEQRQSEALAEAFSFLGTLYMVKNDNDGALKNLDTAVDIDPNHYETYGLRGVIFLSRKSYNEAIKEFDRGIKLSDQPHFYLNRGVSFLMLGREKEAQRDFDKFIAIYPQGGQILDLRKKEARAELLARTK